MDISVNNTGTFYCGGAKNQSISSTKVCDFVRDCTETAADEDNCGKVSSQIQLYYLILLLEFLEYCR